MIVPLLSLIAGALWMRGRVTGGPPPSAPRIGDPNEVVAGWQTADDAGPLVAELFPLHPSPERQAFEARALRERLGLGPGEPFRLRLSLVDPGSPVDPWTLCVRAGGADVLAVVRPGPGLGASGARSPLATLLSPPSELAPDGRIAEVVLWGQRPAATPTLAFRTRDGREVALELEPHARPRRELPAFLARLERPDGDAAEEAGSDPAERGKEPGARASDPAGARVDDR